jgi:hypothetical protein
MRTIHFMASILVLSLLFTTVADAQYIGMSPTVPTGGFGASSGFSGQINGNRCDPPSSAYGDLTSPGATSGCYGQQSTSLGFPGYAEVTGATTFYVTDGIQGPFSRGVASWLAGIYAPYGCSTYFGYDWLTAQVVFYPRIGPYSDGHWDAGIFGEVDCSGSSCDTGEQQSMWVIAGFDPAGGPYTWGDGLC